MSTLTQFTAAQLHRLFGAARKVSLEFGTYLELLYITGVRFDAMRTIDGDDFNSEKRELTVSCAGVSCVVSVDERAIELLQQAITLSRWSAPFDLSVTEIRAEFVLACEAIGVPNVRLGDLSRTYFAKTSEGGHVIEDTDDRCSESTLAAELYERAANALAFTLADDISAHHTLMTMALTSDRKLLVTDDPAFSFNCDHGRERPQLWNAASDAIRHLLPDWDCIEGPAVDSDFCMSWPGGPGLWGFPTEEQRVQLVELTRRLLLSDTRKYLMSLSWTCHTLDDTEQEFLETYEGITGDDLIALEPASRDELASAISRKIDEMISEADACLEGALKNARARH